MYARFLKEAADITGNKNFADIGDQVKSIGDDWQVVAEILKKGWDADKPAELLPEASEKIIAIAKREESAWTALRDVLKTG